ncbi:LOW QUALITY PROTEIN: hypothetical protein IFM46972_01575 [Aspergillus udagawae]|uniref:Cis-aconitate decarboxylase n=1 Tax=Aspergillus udagawae TaxID=91492 RepID=A0A8H3RIF3_9EURO|nr:LOW QUALITY PROTEIN: hypothetical protein IFM46972_01575 [Aspergillus udagawae]
MAQSKSSPETRTEKLARWAANLQYHDLPEEVIQRTKELFIDWLGCTIAGRHHPAVAAIVRFATQMGPSSGKSELIDGSLGLTSSPAFASLINGASSHVVEQDDLHNRSIMHPATVIFPAALAVAQDIHADGKEFITACVGMKSAVGPAGTLEKATTRYACNSRAHVNEPKTTTVQKFHSTATGGVVGVAAAVARLLHLDVNQTLSAIGTAGTQAAGLWQFLLDATHSKQVHTGKACFDGIFAAYSARDGLLGPRDILEGSRGMGAALVPGETSPEAIGQGLGLDYAVLGSSFKWHASCRHTHPSVDALLALMAKHQVKFHEIDSVVARTYQAAINVLGLTGRGETVHQSKFSMGFVLAVAAKNGQAMITDFTEEVLEDAELREFQQRVTMELDPEIDARFPKQWQGTIVVVCKDGRQYTESVEYLKGDPENPLTRAELETKFRALATYGGVADTTKVANLLQKGWGLESQSTLHGFSF